MSSAYSDLSLISPFSFKGSAGSQAGAGNGASEIEVGWFAGGDVVRHCKGVDCCKCPKSGTSDIFYANSLEELKKACACQGSDPTCCKSGEVSCCNLAKNMKGLKAFYVVSNGGAKKIVGFFPKWYTVSLLQFLLALNISNKLVMIIALSSALSHTTDLTAFTFAIGQLIRPFKYLRIPVREITLVISLAIRFIPSLLTETLRIVKAQSSRGIDFKNGRIRDKASAFLALFIPLFIISMIKSKELSNAMTSRAYLPKAGRTSYRSYSTNYWSLSLFGVVIVFISICYYFVFSSSYWSAFGPLDPLLLVAV